MNRKLLDYNPQFDVLEPAASMRTDFELGRADAAASIFDQSEQLELAAALYEVRGQDSLQRFLQKMMRQTGLRGDQAPLQKLLQQAGQRILPRSAGLPSGTPDHIHGPAHILGLELEGLSPEDQEFEVVRGFIRFAEDAIRNVKAGRSDAGAAIRLAARRHAPGLLHR